MTPCEADRGVFDVYEGTPLALYQVSNATHKDADLNVKGMETPEIAALWD